MSVDARVGDPVDGTDGSSAASGGLVAGHPGAALLLIVALAYGSFAQGAFYADQFQFLLGLVLLVAIVLVARARPVDRWVLVGVGALTVGVTLFASTVAGTPVSAGLPAIGLGLAVATAVALGISAGPALAERAALGVIACAGVVAATAWFGVAFRHDDWTLASQGLSRGASTLTYANATAAMVGMGLVLALSRLSLRREPVLAVASLLLAVGLLSAMSRAGWAATGVGLLVVGHQVGWRRLVRAATPVLVGALIAMAALLPSTVELQPNRPHLAVAGLVLGVAAVWALNSGLLGGRLLVAVALVGLALAVQMGVGSGPGGDLLSSRFDLASQDRVDEWQAAWAEFRGAPLAGVGPGQVELIWTEPDGRVRSAAFTHNEYLELAASHGLIGIGALAAAIALVRRGLRRPGHTAAPWVRSGAAAALAVFAVHSAFDFLWHIPVLPLTAALLLGLLLSRRTDVSVPIPTDLKV